MKSKDIKIGDKFNNLTIISEPERKYASNQYKWFSRAKCYCGKEKEITLKEVISSRVSSCGCASIKNITKIGDKFNDFTVISDAYKSNNKRKVKVKCLCGKIQEIDISSLFGGQKRCRQCFKNKNNTNYKHGISKTRIYKIWSQMKDRCNPTQIHTKSYKYYAGKGIKVCDEWKNLQNFLQWSYTHGYTDSLTLDRKNPELDYCPNNCEWVTRNENSYRRNAYYRDKIEELRSKIIILEKENATLLYKLSVIKNDNLQ